MNNNIKEIRFGFNVGNITVNRLVDIDLNGYSAGDIIYNLEETGEVNLINSGTPTTVEEVNVTAPNVTFNLGSGITVNGETNINNVAIGTFNTEAIHNGTVLLKDPDGGSVNFTNSTVNAGIEIKPETAALKPMIIKGDAPVSSDEGFATITISGEEPKVKVEGNTKNILIDTPNTEFELSDGANASKVIITNNAQGSKITTSKTYGFELIFEEGQTVSNIVNSGLFGEQQIRVVGYPAETEFVKASQLLKLDTQNMSVLYTFEETDLVSGEADVVGSEGNLFKIDTDSKKVLFKGNVAATTIRAYLEENDLFGVSEDFNEGRVVMSFYDVLSDEVNLYASEPINDGDQEWDYKKRMRVLVGTNEQHGLYILTKKLAE